MGRVTYGEVLAGAASEDELVPFGGEQAHKAFALAVGLQLLVDSLVAEPGTARCCSSLGRRRIRCRRYELVLPGFACPVIARNSRVVLQRGEVLVLRRVLGDDALVDLGGTPQLGERRVVVPEASLRAGEVVVALPGVRVRLQAAP